MSDLAEFDAAFEACLPVGQVLERQANASSSGAGGKLVSRSDLRYVFEPGTGEAVDLPRAVEEVVKRLRKRLTKLEHEQTRREHDGRLVSGRFDFERDEQQGELTYRLSSDEATQRVEVELTLRETGEG